MQRLLKHEGPKYQYGTGCLSDSVIGVWMARIYGIDVPLKPANVHSNLRAIFRHNFKTDLSQHANAQRPGYAMGNEPGLLLCSWPRGDKPTLPFVYSDEVWTGIEYQVASHLIHEGLVEEGLTIVKAARRRYDGRTRNPWNEYECGNWYARAMSSYALLGALSGFRYSAVEKTVWFRPRLKATAIPMLLFDGIRIRHDCAARANCQYSHHRGRACDRETRFWELAIADRLESDGAAGIHCNKAGLTPGRPFFSDSESRPGAPSARSVTARPRFQLRRYDARC